MTVHDQRSMKAIYLVIFFCPLQLLCQSSIGVQLHHGLDRMLNGPNITRHRLGHSAAIGISALIKRKQQVIEFEPALLLCKSTFRFELTEGLSLKLAQRALRLVLQAAIPAKKYTRIKAGLFMQGGHASVISMISKINSYYSYSNSELFKGYEVQQIQAGLSAGISFVMGKDKKNSFDLVADLHATPVVLTDYRYSLNPSALDPVTLFDTKGRPVAVKAGFTFRFLKRKNRDFRETEEN
jgi:hypothetical protein